MSDSFKDKANYFRFKHIDKDKIPEHLKDLIMVMNVNYTGYRCGNNRQYYKNAKIIARKVNRAKTKDSIRNDLKNYDNLDFGD
jgi:hypothetical protein